MKTDSPNDDDLPRPGDVINDKYAIVRTLGRGGMGVVYEGQHLKLDQRVAIKVLLRNEVAELMTRFEREARAAGQLHGTNVAPIGWSTTPSPRTPRAGCAVNCWSVWSKS